MENLIPVLVIGGIVGFLLWKNKDKIISVADRFKKPAPVVETPKPFEVVTQPEAPKPDAIEADKPITPPVITPVVEKPRELSVTERLFAISNEERLRRDAEYQRYLDKKKKGGDYFAQFPAEFSNVTLGKGGLHRFIASIGPSKKVFQLFVHEGWNGGVHISVIPDPRDVNSGGGSKTTITVEGVGVAVKKSGPMESVKVNLSGSDKRGATTLPRGTYEVGIVCEQENKVIFDLNES